MSIKELIIHQFEACYHKDTWYVSMHTAVKNLNAKDAVAKSASDNHSIFELVSHLYFFNKLELNRFKGIPDTIKIQSSKDSFQTNDDWEQLVSKMMQLFSEWITEVENSKEQRIIDNLESFQYMNLHNAYHIGQIVHIRKELGLWDSTHGVHYRT